MSLLPTLKLWSAEEAFKLHPEFYYSYQETRELDSALILVVLIIFTWQHLPILPLGVLRVHLNSIWNDTLSQGPRKVQISHYISKFLLFSISPEVQGVYSGIAIVTFRISDAENYRLDTNIHFDISPFSTSLLGVIVCLVFSSFFLGCR